jgi:polyisoprenoid-binding protein YceI
MSATEAPPSLDSGTWILDPENSEVEFVSRTMWGAVPVRGSFSEYAGELELSATPAIRLVIQAASLDTANAKRDQHLRSGDFFGVDANPEVVFEASAVHVHGDHLHVSGTLSAGGRRVDLEPTAHIAPVDGGFEIDAVARVNLRQLGMSSGTGGMIKAKAWLSVRGRLIRADR